MVCRKPLLLLSLLLAPATAAAADDVAAANVSAMGGAAAGRNADNSAVTVNPGALPLARRYDFDGHFSYGPSTDMTWSGSVVDTQTNDHVSFGVTYLGRILQLRAEDLVAGFAGRFCEPFLDDELPGWFETGVDPVNTKQIHGFTIGIATPLWDRRIGLGLSGRMDVFDSAARGTGVTGNMDVGLGFAPIPALSFGIAGRNVLPVADQSDTPTAVVGGAHVAFPPWFAATADFQWQTEQVAVAPYTIGAGLEGGVASVRARTGYRYDGTFGTHNYTWGLGLENDAGAIDYSMSIPVGGPVAPADLVQFLSVRIKAGSIKDMLDDDSEPTF